MATVVVSQNAAVQRANEIARNINRRSGNHRRMTIALASGGSPITVPYAPRAVNHSDLTPGYTEIDRAMGSPIIRRNPPRLRKMSFTLFFGSTSPDASQHDRILSLVNIARGRREVRVNYGRFETGLWRINSLSIDSNMRNRQGEITRAEVSVEFIASEMSPINRGPVSGGNRGPVSGGNKGTRGKKKRPKFYRVKRGDTLSKIAVRFYGNAKAWKRIATANKIKNPRKLKVGRKLRLP